LDMYGLIYNLSVNGFCGLVWCVKAYTTVGTVCSSALLWCLVDLDVLNNKVTGVKALGIGVGLGVLEETEKELGRLYWPAGTGDTKLFSYRSKPSQQLPANSKPLMFSSIQP
jgi:hypothetical protein